MPRLTAAKAILFFSGALSPTLAFLATEPRTKSSRNFSSLALSASSITRDVTDLLQAKATLVERLKEGEDENSEALKPLLEILYKSYEASAIDARTSENPTYNGDWKNINTPAFSTRIGFNEEGLPLYQVGGLTFGLLEVGKDVVCVVDNMIQQVHFADQLPDPSVVPESLVKAFEKNPQSLRTNHIDTIFHVPASEDTPEVRGTLRMEGYTIPNEEETNRYDTWFVRGHCIADHDVDPDAFAKYFGSDPSKLSYNLPKPMEAYSTVVYLDEALRVSIGSRGSLMINGCERADS